MKKIFLVIICWTFLSSDVFAGNSIRKETRGFNDTIIPFLTSLNLGYYESKPIDTLLTVMPSGYISMAVQSRGNLKYARVLKITYPNKIKVVVFVKELTHMNPCSETCTWDINLFKKEKIACVEIWEGNIRRNEMCDYWN